MAESALSNLDLDDASDAEANGRTVIRARAPLRISFGGGGTDVPPYVNERGGLVINATINRYAYVTIIPNDRGEISMRSLDYEEELVYDLDEGMPEDAHQMKLARGVVDRFDVDERGRGFDLYTHADCPPGSGLGSSSTMVVALIGAFDKWLGLGLDPYETARLAYEIERIDLGIEGGKQDQYAATFGGFNYMEFRDDVALINPLRIPDDGVAELEYALVMAFTGTSRYSSDIIEDQIDNYEEKNMSAVEAMDRTRELAVEMKRVILKGRFYEFGKLLHTAWEVKKQMASKITNPNIDEMYEAAREAGAMGGKISGAGGGGFMFCFTEFDRQHAVKEALAEHGADVVDFGFTDRGLQAWTRTLR
jgi:D-glycero-alpha-D-manno-heptose-7-phosphate kinase